MRPPEALKELCQVCENKPNGTTVMLHFGKFMIQCLGGFELFHQLEVKICHICCFNLEQISSVSSHFQNTFNWFHEVNNL